MKIENKETLGRKWKCWRCRTKFYDFGKSKFHCGECGAEYARDSMKKYPSPDDPDTTTDNDFLMDTDHIPDDDELTEDEADETPTENS